MSTLEFDVSVDQALSQTIPCHEEKGLYQIFRLPSENFHTPESFVSLWMIFSSINTIKNTFRNTTALNNVSF
jgi:hypothetical protein